MNFRIIKSIEGEVNQPVFVKLLTKQYNIFFFLQISNYVFWQFDNISRVCLMKSGLERRGPDD